MCLRDLALGSSAFVFYGLSRRVVGKGLTLVFVVFQTAWYDPPRRDAAAYRQDLRRQLCQRPMFQYLITLQRRGEANVFPEFVFDDTAGDAKKAFSDWSVSLGEAHEIFQAFKPEKLFYRFSKAVFTNGIVSIYHLKVQ